MAGLSGRHARDLFVYLLNRFPGDRPECASKAVPIPSAAAVPSVTVSSGTITPNTSTESLKTFVFKSDSASSLQDVPLQDLPDDDIARAVARGAIPMHSLEAQLGNTLRAAAVRRRAVEIKTGRSLAGLPLENYDYDVIRGACCEMVIGHVTIPIGVAGPLLLDGTEFFVPMATTEGCLVASTNRGCKAICAAGGARSVVLRDGMTRAPAVQLPSAVRAAELKAYAESPRNWAELAEAFNSSSRFARLRSLRVAVAGRNAFIRVECGTGDAMGMNMVSKGTASVLGALRDAFPDMRVVSMSGNYCADKKATAVNWIHGRGKSVVCEATIPGHVNLLSSPPHCPPHPIALLTPLFIPGRVTTVAALVELNMVKNLVGSPLTRPLCTPPYSRYRLPFCFPSQVETVLKTTVAALVELNTVKNLVGSAMAGAVGGSNAHASNIVTAVFLATGQDPAQNVESSQCLTLLEAVNNGADLHVSVTLPAIEVGTVGGGTFLAPQDPAQNVESWRGWWRQQLPKLLFSSPLLYFPLPQAAALAMLGVKGAHKTEPGLNAQQLVRVVAAAVPLTPSLLPSAPPPPPPRGSTGPAAREGRARHNQGQTRSS
ncbi:unnamed protein product [Closterium sp. NIES-65]|nr:unnamed protein product [Closterium sp. NIES-65]